MRYNYVIQSLVLTSRYEMHQVMRYIMEYVLQLSSEGLIPWLISNYLSNEKEQEQRVEDHY